VYEAEWWHFDYQDWQKYPITNIRFDKIGMIFHMSSDISNLLIGTEIRPDFLRV
jgi:hypothetical protein